MNFMVMTVCGTATYSDPNGRRIEIPQIWLHGKWLESLGFKPGRYVNVLGSEGLIRLELVKNGDKL